MNIGCGRRGLIGASHGKLELAAIPGVLGAAVCSRVVAIVAIK